ncbi:MAG: sulfite exporter TauE/SafE family protein [Pseudomonadota bacterium]
MADPLTYLPLLLAMLALGAFAGVLAGLLGVGGGIILVPGFFYAFSTLGFDSPQLMQICLATSLATIIVTSLRSVQGHAKKGTVDWAVLRSWAPGIAVGAVLGVLIAAQLRSQSLQAIFGVLGICIGAYMGLGRPHWRLAESMPTGLKRAVASPAVGFLSVLMGVGGGSFGVPFMSLHGKAIHEAVATAAGFGALIAIPSVLAFLFVPIDPSVRPPLTIGAVNLVAFGVIIAMTLITTPWGVKLAHAMNPTPLKRVFAFFLTLVALNMLRTALF